ncbi:MAG: hypothetical protein KF726_10275 [Anaerolineae bacterium]|nr:hypothetical protein [Anaerolineae bacterium]
MTLRRLTTRLALICFGVGIAILVAEIAIRALYPALPQNLQIALRDVHVTPFSDARLAPPPLWQPDERYQYIVRPGAENLTQAGSPTVLFPVSSYSWWGGRVGFRSPQPEDGRVPAVVVGDSHTFCFTSIDNCWVTLLSAETGISFADLGQPVTGSISHARIFYDFVAKPELGLQQPKIVLWQFFGNDFNDDYGLARSEGRAKTPPNTEVTSMPERSALQLWLLQNSGLFALIDALTRRDAGVELFTDPYRVIDQGVDIYFGQRYIRDSFDMTQARNQEGEELSQQAILETRDVVQKNGGAFVMIVMPAKEEVYERLTQPKIGAEELAKIAEPRRRILDFCKAQQIDCLDLLPVLQAQANQNMQVFFSTDTHLNEIGNRVVASAVSQFLRDHGLVS